MFLRNITSQSQVSTLFFARWPDCSSTLSLNSLPCKNSRVNSGPHRENWQLSWIVKLSRYGPCTSLSPDTSPLITIITIIIIIMISDVVHSVLHQSLSYVGVCRRVSAGVGVWPGLTLSAPGEAPMVRWNYVNIRQLDYDYESHKTMKFFAQI